MEGVVKKVLDQPLPTLGLALFGVFVAWSVKIKNAPHEVAMQTDRSMKVMQQTDELPPPVANLANVSTKVEEEATLSTGQPNERVRQYLEKTCAYIMIVTHGSLPVSDDAFFFAASASLAARQKEGYLREALRQPNDPNALHMQELYETAAEKAFAYVESLGCGLMGVVGVGYDGDGFWRGVPKAPTAMALHVMMKLKSKGYHPYLLEAQVVGYSNPPLKFFDNVKGLELQIDGQKVPVDVFEDGGANVLHYPYVQDASDVLRTSYNELKESVIGLANPKHGAWDKNYGGTAGNPAELAGSSAAHAAFLQTYGDFPACLIAAWDDRLAARPYTESICHSTVSACFGEAPLFAGKHGRTIEVREHLVLKDGVLDGEDEEDV